MFIYSINKTLNEIGSSFKAIISWVKPLDLFGLLLLCIFELFNARKVCLDGLSEFIY